MTTLERHISSLNAKDLAPAWWVHCCPSADGAPKTSDAEVRDMVRARMNKLGVTDADMARLARSHGLLSDERLAEVLK